MEIHRNGLGIEALGSLHESVFSLGNDAKRHIHNRASDMNGLLSTLASHLPACILSASTGAD